MSQEIRCPDCGRPVSKLSADGRIGFCDYHKKWYAIAPDTKGQASEANQKYQEEVRRKKDEEERARLQREKDRQHKAGRALALRTGVVAAAGMFSFG